MKFYLLRESRGHLYISIANNTFPLQQYFFSNPNLRFTVPTIPPPADLLTYVLCLDAVVTDVVCGEVGIYGLFISRKLQRLLENFQLPPHAYFKGSLTQQIHLYEAGDLTRQDHIVDDYQLLHLPKLSTKRPLLDFTKSEFYTNWDGFRHCKGPVRFKSFSRTFSRKARIDLYDSVYNGSILPSGHPNAKLYLKEDAYQYDLLPSIGFEQEYYVSERLQQALTEQQITGIQLTEAPWIQRA